MSKTLIAAVTALTALVTAGTAQAQCTAGICGTSPVIIIQPAPVLITPASRALPSPFAAPDERSRRTPGDHHLRDHHRLREIQRPPLRQRSIGFGLHGGLSYSGTNEETSWGGGLSLRLIPRSRFASELSVDLYAAGDDRLVIPISLSGLFFFRTHRMLQPYITSGFDAVVERPREGGLSRDVDRTWSLGGHAGLGVELLLGRLGVQLEARAFAIAPVDQARSDSIDDIEWGLTFNTGLNLYRSHHRRAPGCRHACRAPR